MRASFGRGSAPDAFFAPVRAFAFSLVRVRLFLDLTLDLTLDDSRKTQFLWLLRRNRHLRRPAGWDD